MSAWKDLERRVARALGGERSGPLGRHNSDARGTRFAVECKRTTKYQLRAKWIEQARRQGKVEGAPWLLVISEHGDRRPIVCLDFWEFTEVAQKAGLIPTPLEIEPERQHEPPPFDVPPTLPPPKPSDARQSVLPAQLTPLIPPGESA